MTEEIEKSKFLAELKRFFELFPDYTLGESLYAVTRGVNRAHLFDYTGEELIDRIESAQIFEKNDR